MQSLLEFLFVASMLVPTAAVAVGAAALAVSALIDRRPRTGRIEVGGHAFAGRH